MQPPYLRDRDDAPTAGRLDVTRIGRIPFKRQVASRLVIVREVVGEYPQ